MSQYPKWFDDVESITLYDGLSEVLGTFKEGIIKIKYLPIVKMAGHSCPTVAGAYLMTLRALKTLYPDTLPVRGEIKVSFKEDSCEGVAGVIAQVISNITGATDTTGFKGLGGKHSRIDLMNFKSEIGASARFERVDTGKMVDVYYNHSSIPGDPRMQQLMPKVLGEIASDEEKQLFGELWQERVRKILIENCDNDQVCKVVEL